MPVTHSREFCHRTRQDFAEAGPGSQRAVDSTLGWERDGGGKGAEQTIRHSLVGASASLSRYHEIHEDLATAGAEKTSLLLLLLFVLFPNLLAVIPCCVRRRVTVQCLASAALPSDLTCVACVRRESSPQIAPPLECGAGASIRDLAASPPVV